MKAYLDNAASAVCYPLADFPLKNGFIGNPSSLHPTGLSARQALLDTKDTLCDAFGGKRSNYLFTSGATESANLAIQGIARSLKERAIPRDEIIVSQIEHPAVYETVHALQACGFKALVAPVNAQGVVEPDTVINLLTERTAMVCIMAVNNETGVVQPVDTIFRQVKKTFPKVITLCDTVQALCKGFVVPLDVTDVFFGSGHKLGGLNGGGFLYLSDRVFISPLFYGGGQQHDLRPGTENPLALISLACAIKQENASSHPEKVKALGSLLLTTLEEKGIRFSRHGHPAKTSDYIYSLHFDGVDSGEAFAFLACRGVCVSRGSACSSSDTKPSRVLSAMGLSPTAMSETLRVSLSPFTTPDEIQWFCDCMETLTNR